LIKLFFLKEKFGSLIKKKRRGSSIIRNTEEVKYISKQRKQSQEIFLTTFLIPIIILFIFLISDDGGIKFFRAIKMAKEDKFYSTELDDFELEPAYY